MINSIIKLINRNGFKKYFCILALIVLITLLLFIYFFTTVFTVYSKNFNTNQYKLLKTRIDELNKNEQSVILDYPSTSEIVSKLGFPIRAVDYDFDKYIFNYDMVQRSDCMWIYSKPPIGGIQYRLCVFFVNSKESKVVHVVNYPSVYSLKIYKSNYALSLYPSRNYDIEERYEDEDLINIYMPQYCEYPLIYKKNFIEKKSQLIILK